jgi:hypothetical protein
VEEAAGRFKVDDSSAIWVNNIWYDGLIMDSGGQLIHSVEFVHNQRPKALMKMDRACSSPDAKTICQDDVRFSLRLADVKAPSTAHQVEFVTYLFDTNLALIFTWGDLSQRLSLLGRILYVSLASHTHLASSLNYIVCPMLFVSQRIRAPPRYSLSRPMSHGSGSGSGSTTIRFDSGSNFPTRFE